MGTAGTVSRGVPLSLGLPVTPDFRGDFCGFPWENSEDFLGRPLEAVLGHPGWWEAHCGPHSVSAAKSKISKLNTFSIEHFYVHCDPPLKLPYFRETRLRIEYERGQGLSGKPVLRHQGQVWK